MKKRGLQEVLHLEYEFGNRDFGPIASRVKDANPDFLWGGTNGIDPVLMLEAMKRIDYRPPAQVHLFPAPGPMLKMPEAQGSLALTNFEAHPPFTDDPVIAQFVKTYAERSKEAGIPIRRSTCSRRSCTPPGRCSRRWSPRRRAWTTRRSPRG